MATMKNKLKLITIEPFGQELLVYYGNPKELHKELNKNEKASKFLRKYGKSIELDEFSNASLWRDRKSGRPFFLFIEKMKKGKYLDSVIMHELVHLLDRLSIYYEFQEETEFRAYLFESLFRKIKEIIK